MHARATILAAAAMSVMAVSAHGDMDHSGDLELDMDNAPSQCREICRPIADLVRQCNVDLDDDDNDDNDDDDDREELLEAQCVCTNDSFDVANVAAQCQSCVSQHVNDGHTKRGLRRRDHTSGDDDHDHDDHDHDDDRDDNDNDNDHDDDGHDHDDILEDINAIVHLCGFPTTTYASTAAPSTTISPSATAPTAASQLTTTITHSAQPTNSGSSDNVNDDNDDDNDDGDDSDDDGDDDGNGNAAGALRPSWLAGALIAGAAMLM